MTLSVSSFRVLLCNHLTFPYRCRIPALNIYEKVSPPAAAATKVRYSSASTDSTSQQPRYQPPTNRSVSVDLHHSSTGSQRNSLILQQQQQHSNRNSMDHPHSNRSSLDVSQSSYNTLIIHDNNDTQPLFSTPSKHELYFINSSPSPPNYGMKKEKSASRSFSNYASAHMHGAAAEMAPITENEQQYLNQSYVLKHLAKEVRIPSQNSMPVTVGESTRDSGVSENNSSSNNQNWSNDSANGGRNKSKSQPDLTKLVGGPNDSQELSNSAMNTLNFNDFEQLEVENNKLRQQLNDCLMKVAKSQKVSHEKFSNQIAQL